MEIAGDQLKQGTLARAIAAEDDPVLIGPHLPADVAQNFVAAEINIGLLDVDEHLAVRTCGRARTYLQARPRSGPLRRRAALRKGKRLPDTLPRDAALVQPERVRDGRKDFFGTMRGE